MAIRAACHVHSTWSYDGSWPLEDLANTFAGRGYRVLMMTEHDRGFTTERLKTYREACAAVCSARMLVVPGIEYSDAQNRVHVLVWGDLPFFGEGLPTGELLTRVKEANGLAVLAHPSRKTAWTRFEASWAEALLGIEIWNRKYDGWAPSDTAPALLEKADVVPFVGLDFHTWRQSFPLAMMLDLSGRIEEKTVLDCLRTRRCQARVFGQALPVKPSVALRIAERGRRYLASAIRQSRSRVRWKGSK